MAPTRRTTPFFSARGSTARAAAQQIVVKGEQKGVDGGVVERSAHVLGGIAADTVKVAAALFLELAENL
jgi:hypothetical protein